jgi:hypothetical protein
LLCFCFLSEQKVFFFSREEKNKHSFCARVVGSDPDNDGERMEEDLLVNRLVGK